MYYFAYGSNLNKEQMIRRCPKAKPIGALVLPKARLVFRGYADVEYDESSEVHGGLWEITKDCEKALDRYEGVHRDLYRKTYIRVKVGKKVANALVYQMNADYYESPPPFYLGIVRKGYKDFGLNYKALNEAVAWTEYLSEDDILPGPSSNA